MANVPVVALIGRPNTGKSTLFNRLIGKRQAIVSEIPGTTRDHVSGKVETDHSSFLLIDTGGIGSTRDKDFESDVKGQSLLALESADLILFTINAKEEITSDDRKVVELLRKNKRKHVPVIVVLTKADTPGREEDVVANFHEMNVGEAILPVSAPHNLGVEPLLTEIESHLLKLRFKKGKIELPDYDEDEVTPLEDPTRPARVAIVGRPNVGKSSIVNAMMSTEQRERSPLLVSDIAGTTRDAIDAEVKHQGKSYILVDTAGLKKRSRLVDELEHFSMIRTITAIEDCDIVVLVLDATAPISHQDKRIAGMAVESGKGLILLLNKIDMLKGQDRKAKTEEIAALLQFCKFAKVIPTSAKTKEGLLKLFDVVELVQQSRVRRISTRELHRWFEQTAYGKPLGQIGKVKHLTQAKDIPPTFVLFVKNPKQVNVTQLRFLENRLRETFGFDGTPIRWIIKATETDKGKPTKEFKRQKDE